MDVVHCHHCGTKYRADLDKIPVAGKMLKCAKCGDIFGVLKHDEYYQAHFPAEICTFILHHKHSGQISNLKYDLNRLQILETFLKERHLTLLNATPKILQEFLREIAQRFSPRHVRGMSRTLQELYTLLLEQGLISANPMAKPADTAVTPAPARHANNISCSKCAHTLDINLDEIPPYGECAICTHCGYSFQVMKPDSYYHKNYSPSIAAFILQRKRTKNIANLEFDLQRLEEMEHFLAKDGQSLTGIHAEEIQYFLKRLSERMNQAQVEGFRSTITDFYAVLTQLGLVAKHQVNHPTLLETAQLEEPHWSEPTPTTSVQEQLKRSRTPLMFMVVSISAALICVAIYFGWIQWSQLLESQEKSQDKAAPPSPAKGSQTVVSLHMAAKQGLTKDLRALIHANANLNEGTPPFDETPLHLAAYHGQKEAVWLLLEAGADPNRANTHGSTPLHKAAAGNQADIARMLLESKANIDARNESGRTPLYEAMQRGSEPLVSLLIDAGADVNAVSSNGNTPMHRAASEGNTMAIKLMLKAGGRIDLVNQNGETPLQVAQRTKRENSVATLKRAEANLAGRTPKPSP